MIDSTYTKAHRTASSLACKEKDRKIGRSAGGYTTKIHFLCNEEGLPLDFEITGGEVHDIKMAISLLDENVMEGLIADKAYGSVKLRKYLESRKLKICIPPKLNSKMKISFDKKVYKIRHKVENAFAKIKDRKGIALRTCRCAHTFESFIALTLINIFF